MKSTIYLIIAICNFIVFTLSAQDENPWAGKYQSFPLNDGSFVLGYILDETETAYSVVISTGDTVNIFKSMIVNQSRSINYEGSFETADGRIHFDSGFYGGMQALSIKTVDYDFFGIQLYRLYIGYHVNRDWSVEFSQGLEYHNIADGTRWGSDVWGTPIELRLKRNAYLGETKGYVLAGLGYFSVFDSFDDIEMPGYGNLGVGITFAARKRFRMNIEYLARVLYAKGTSTFWDGNGNIFETEFQNLSIRPMLAVGFGWRL